MGPGQIGSASWQGKDAGRLDQPEPSRTAGRLWCARVRPRAGFGALAGHRRTAVRTPTTHRRPMATQARRVHPVSILESVAPRVARDSAPSALARPRLGSVAKATGALGAPVAGLIALVAIGAAGAGVGAGLGSLPGAPGLSGAGSHAPVLVAGGGRSGRLPASPPAALRGRDGLLTPSAIGSVAGATTTPVARPGVPGTPGTTSAATTPAEPGTSWHTTSQRPSKPWDVNSGSGTTPQSSGQAPGGGTSGQPTGRSQTSSTQIGSTGSGTSSPTTSSGGAPPRSTSTTGGAAQTTTASTSTSDGSSQTTTSGSDGADSGTTTTNQGY